MSERVDAWVNVTITGTAGHVDQSQLAGLIRRLAAKHGDQFSASAVAQCVRRCAGELLRAGIRSGLLPATEAMAGARLRLRPPAPPRPLGRILRAATNSDPGVAR
jgi:hypothetical protein